MDTSPTQIQIRGASTLRLHAEVAGPVDGPLVVLLHGFPEFWYGWRNQIAPLAQAGFHVVAPDQRGYNLSDKPAGIGAYHLDALAADVLSILDHFKREQAFVVGHDWGAAVAWHLAIHHPERVERLAILNVPHPGAMARALRRLTLRQFLRSWYIAFFQIPALPEFLLSRGNFSALRRALKNTSRPKAFTEEDLRRYVQAWRQPGALTAMLNWYRAVLRSGAYTSTERVRMPTMILWGERDVALIPELARWSLEYCEQGELVTFPDATHWLQHEEVEQVNGRLIQFFKRSIE